MYFIDFRDVLFLLHLFAALSFVLAVFFAVKLYRETDRGWYWFTLVLSAVFIALPQWFTFVIPRAGFRPDPLFPLIDEASGILSGLLFALSCYGMHSTMRHIRKRLENDDGLGRKAAKRGARKR